MVGALDSVHQGEIIDIAGGVYVLPAGRVFSLPAKSTARSTQRAIITGSDGYPPQINLNEKSVLSGIWFGGTKYPSEVGNFLNILDLNATITECTFWGYSDCIAGNVGKNSVISKNRFVNCGYGGLYHDIYCSGGTAGTISEGIHVGGSGYKIQLFHSPVGITIHANFMAGSLNGDMAIQEGYDVITNNILWGPSVQYWNAGNCQFDKNIFGVDRQAFYDVTLEGNIADGNVFCNGQTTFGTNPQTWNTAAITANLGHTKAEIDTAISNLISKFGQTTQQIHDDATIETDFTVLRDVINAWKDQ